MLKAGVVKAFLVLLVPFLILLTHALIKGGMDTGSSWVWPVATQESAIWGRLDTALAQMETGMTARLDAIQFRLNGVVANFNSSSAGGMDGDAFPSSDVSKLLFQQARSSSEKAELEKMQYCRRYGKYSATEPWLQQWVPAARTYLLALCDYGQISNRLNCVRNYMLLATLLRRTLVVAEQEAGGRRFDYRLVLDVAHARECIGGPSNHTMISVQEYLQMEEATQVVVTKVWCWKAKCSLASYSDLFPEIAFPDALEGSNLAPKIQSLEDLVGQFGEVKEAMISFGDLYAIKSLQGVAVEVYNSAVLPFPNLTCNLVMQPHQAIVLAAKGFVNTIVGARFMSVHLRRGDFHHFWGQGCVRKKAAPFSTQGCKILAIAAIARCILEKLQGSAIQIVYLATNARSTELSILESILRGNPRPITLIRAPKEGFSKDSYFWALSWNSLNLDKEPLASAAFDKLVCSMGKIFMGSRGSTFTSDIIRMRAALNTQGCQDQDICAPFLVESDDHLPSFNVSFTDTYLGTNNYR